MPLLALTLLGCAQAGTGPLRAAGDWDPVVRYLDSAVAAGAAPGAVLAVSHGGRAFVHGTGRLGPDDARRPDEDTRWDLASLTKVLALTPLVRRAVADGQIALDSPATAYLPEVAGRWDGVTVRHLLVHAAGLPAWRPLYRDAGSRAALVEAALATPLEVPPGTRTTYSDIGIIALTAMVERTTGARLDTVFAAAIAEPLGLRHTGYRPVPDGGGPIAPTERDPWRGRVLRGEVHDENAAAMDGVSGHAGLFSTARDLLVIAEATLATWHADTLARTFATRQGVVPGSSRALGWDTPSDGGSAGTRLGSSAFGHTGFTGTSIWLDPDRDLAIMLLSNRVHPTRENARWTPVRGAVADLVVTTLFPAAR